MLSGHLWQPNITNRYFHLIFTNVLEAWHLIDLIGDLFSLVRLTALISSEVQTSCDLFYL